MQEIERQPLFWNSLVRDVERRGRTLIGPPGTGARLHLVFARRLSLDYCQDEFDIGRGVAARIAEIDDVLLIQWDEAL